MDKPLPRVLVIGHTYVVGVNQGKLDAIAGDGRFEIALLVPDAWKAAGQDRVLTLETPYPGLRIYPARVWLGGRGGAYLYPPLTIRRVVKDFQPDILHVEQEVFSLCAFEIALWAGALRKTLTIFCWENTDRRLPFLRRWTRRLVLNQAQLLVAGNQDAAHWLRQWGYRNRLEVLPQLGVDPLVFAPRSSTPSTSGEFVIGYVGRLVHQKGIDLLFDALRILQGRNHACRLLLCGTGTDEKELERAAITKGVADLVVWRGEVRHEAVPAEMAALDVLVLPSRSVPGWREQFGHVLVEAMAMGVPVIGSKCGEIPNVIGRQDLLFDEEDSKELARLLERMICEPSWRREAEAYGIDRVHEHYTHERVAAQLVSLWEDLPDAHSGFHHA